MEPCVLLEEPRGWGNWLIVPLAPLLLLLVRCFAGTLECPQYTRMPFATLKNCLSPFPLEGPRDIGPNCKACSSAHPTAYEETNRGWKKKGQVCLYTVVQSALWQTHVVAFTRVPLLAVLLSSRKAQSSPEMSGWKLTSAELSVKSSDSDNFC